MLLGDAEGNKCAPFLVFKTRPSVKADERAANTKFRNGFGRSLWKKIAPLQSSTGCRIFGNAKGWWNSDLSIEFLRFHFAERENSGEPILLLWDDFSGHWTEQVREYAASINVVLLKVPPRYTYACQPADIAWNKPLKDRLRREWVSQMREQIAQHHCAEAAHREEIELQQEDEQPVEDGGAMQGGAVEESRRRCDAEILLQAAGDMAGSSVNGMLQAGCASATVWADLQHEGVQPRKSAIVQQRTAAWTAFRDCNEADSGTQSDVGDCANGTLHQRRRKKKKKTSEGFQLTAPSRDDIAAWISSAWMTLPVATIAGGFKHVGLLNDTRPLQHQEAEIADDVNTILEAIAKISLTARSKRRTRVNSTDDIPTAGETTDTSDSDTV